jgi:Tfp pilus assembly protein FimV
MDFFERTDLRRSDGSSELNAAPELQGIGIQTKAIKSQTLADNQSATTINEYPALAGKGLKITYKIVRGTLDRTGELIISASTNGVSYDDTYTESGSDVGVDLTAVLDNKDSTAGSETIALKYATTSSGTDATIDYQTTIIA